MSEKDVLLPKNPHICAELTTFNTGGYEQLRGEGRADCKITLILREEMKEPSEIEAIAS